MVWIKNIYFQLYFTEKPDWPKFVSILCYISRFTTVVNSYQSGACNIRHKQNRKLTHKIAMRHIWIFTSWTPLIWSYHLIHWGHIFWYFHFMYQLNALVRYMTLQSLHSDMFQHDNAIFWDYIALKPFTVKLITAMDPKM
jgi:hypothetical protein